MSLRPLYAILILATFGELAGCKALFKKKDPDPAPSAAPVAVAPPPAVIAPVVPELVASTAPVPVAPPALDEHAVPTPQDFEDEAAEKITTANFKAQFASLKKDISK